MKKLLTKVVYIGLCNSFLFGSSVNVITESEAIKLIRQKNVQFITTQNYNSFIDETKILKLKLLSDIDVVGKLSCMPLYSCIDTLENSLDKLHLKKDTKLVIYDESYSIESATLYSLLESIGYKKLKLFNGGSSSIALLDPNQKAYDEYVRKLKEKRELFHFSKEGMLRQKYLSSMRELEKKIAVLKPLLLIKKTSLNKEENSVPYRVKEEDMNYEYLSSYQALKEASLKVKKEGLESNLTIVDTCGTVDIIGSRYGGYTPVVTFIDWKSLVNREQKRMLSKNALKNLFEKMNLNKEHQFYVYCMNDSKKAFYTQIALRLAGYNKVKVFTGNWDTWTGEDFE